MVPVRIQKLLEADGTRTPCFVYDEGTLRELLSRVGVVERAVEVNVLYTLKPFSFLDALQLMSSSVAGFAASSLFEAQLAREVLGERGSVHFTTPGLRPDDLPKIAKVCDYISFNSLSQWDRHSVKASQSASCGLRINPQLSLVADSRYDPCRPHSKLGVPLQDMVEALALAPGKFAGLKGIHFHTNCDSTDFSGLLKTAKIIDAQLGQLLLSLEWINLGGGYLFEDGQNDAAILATAKLFKSKYNLDVFVEPGAALIRQAGLIVSSVVDIFDSGGQTIAVLDTTVNHMPEVFEYGFEPDVVGHDDEGPYNYILAGSSCLAGDVFGTYAFREPLVTGDRLIFENAGAYTLSKAHMFNGIDLPTIYALTVDGDLVFKRDFGYPAFAERWKVTKHAPV